jgi:hypothetical protein
MTGSKSLDFIVIGAQKAGTSSLWQHLSSHPQLHLPRSKEAPFFSHDQPFGRGLEWYLEEFFGEAPSNAQWGTVTPHYMMGTEDADVPEIARRIRAAVPEARLIAVLRDPVERALSHHRMARFRGLEQRAFDAAARDALVPEALERARRRPTETTSYIVQGEYARSLEAYLGVFPRDRLHVALTADLAEDPLATMRSIFAFLGVEADHHPPDLLRRHHRGGFTGRLDAKAEASLKAYLAQQVWPSMPRPRDQRRAFDFWFRQWNVIPDDRLPALDPAVERLLRAHFARDAVRLERLTGATVPWARER